MSNATIVAMAACTRLQLLSVGVGDSNARKVNGTS